MYILRKHLFVRMIRIGIVRANPLQKSSCSYKIIGVFSYTWLIGYPKIVGQIFDVIQLPLWIVCSMAYFLIKGNPNEKNILVIVNGLPSICWWRNAYVLRREK